LSSGFFLVDSGLTSRTAAAARSYFRYRAGLSTIVAATSAVLPACRLTLRMTIHQPHDDLGKLIDVDRPQQLTTTCGQWMERQRRNGAKEPR
jgi:hypothetical protein